jgi:tetratricopeptide (TPR) repeat protein
MDTSSRGRSFEDIVYDILRNKISKGELGVLSTACTIHRRKAYHSRLRNKPIVVDISIEVRLPGCAEWSLLWVWECKDLSRAVPVDDVEEFWAKLQQIAGVNVKGFLATSGPLQDGALNLAKSVGIGVMRILPPDQVMMVLAANDNVPRPFFAIVPDIGEDSKYYRKALTILDFRGVNQEEFGVSEGRLISSWTLLAALMTLDILSQAIAQAENIDQKSDYLLERADVFRNLKDHDRALSDLNDLERNQPNYPKLWNRRGMIFVALGRLEEATECSRRFVQLAPSNIAGRHNLASILQHIGQLEGAVHQYDAWIELQPTEVKPRQLRAECLLLQSKEDEAVIAFESVLSLLDESKESERASIRKVFQSLGRERLSKLYLFRAKRALANGQIDTALREIDLADEVWPENPKSAQLRSDVLRANKET